MANSHAEQKAVLREQMRNTLRAMTPASRESSAVALCASLTEQPVWKNARLVLLFSPLADEPDIRPLLHSARAAGKLTALPRFNATQQIYEAALVHDFHHDLLNGKFGIQEPAAHCSLLPLNRLDLALVPGVAFDWHGRRLGRGKGYYDRLLAEVSGKTCGVAFDQQMVEAIPVEPHDVRLNCILTPSRWLEV